MLDRDAFWREHVLSGRPVIIGELMAAAPIAAIRSRDDAVAKLGMMPLTIRREYSRSLLAALAEGPTAERRVETMSLGAYYRHVDAEPSTERMCIEEPTPPELRALCPVPPLCTTHAGDADPALKSTVFAGNAGNFAPLHYDGDCRHVLLYQVFGQKRVTVIPACHGAALRPIANFSTLLFGPASAAEKEAVVARLGGWTGVIGPGEAVFMPALAYHAAEYLSDGLSVNFRFGRNRYHELVSAHVHLDPQSQRLCAASLAEESVLSEHRARFATLTRALLSPARSTYAKYLQMCEVLADITADLGDEPAPADALSGAPFAAIPEVVEEALLRAHLFRDQLYRHREPESAEKLGVPLVS